MATKGTNYSRKICMSQEKYICSNVVSNEGKETDLLKT